MTVAAVISGAGARDRCRAAVAAQSHAVDRVIEARAAEGLSRARAEGYEWVWVLDGPPIPAQDALERLLAAAHGPERPPLLLASLVLDAAGRPVERLLARADEAYRDRVFRSIQRRLIPIRRASLAGALVHRDAVARHGLPRPERYGVEAGAEWTSRIVRDVAGHRDAAGYLVPTSVVVMADPGEGPSGLGALRALPATMRMVAGGAWTWGESVKAIARLARRTLTGRPPERHRV